MTTNAKNIIPIVSKYFATQPVRKAWLFGSFARGEETPKSDIDILVQLDHSKPIGLHYFHLINDLEQRLGRSVDLVEEEGLMDFARPYVDRDKILLYERTN